MDNLKAFLKENKAETQNIFAEVSSDFKDEEGNVIKWELRSITTSEDEEIRNDCTVFDGERSRLNTGKYIARLVASSVVYPDLYNMELQDSYGVKTPEELLKAMVDKPGDFSRLTETVHRLNGFTSFKEDVETAKN